MILGLMGEQLVLYTSNGLIGFKVKTPSTGRWRGWEEMCGGMGVDFIYLISFYAPSGGSL